MFIGAAFLAGPIAAKAQDAADDAAAAPDPYTQAHDACSQAADSQEVTDETTGVSNWNELFEKCMSEKGFGSQDDNAGDNSGDNASENADVPDDTPATEDDSQGSDMDQ